MRLIGGLRLRSRQEEPIGTTEDGRTVYDDQSRTKVAGGSVVPAFYNRGGAGGGQGADSAEYFS